MAKEAKDRIVIPISRAYLEDLITGFETGDLLLTTSDLSVDAVSNASFLTYMQEKYSYILGDVLFRLGCGKNAERVYVYPELRVAEDSKGSLFVARELYQLPNNTWVLRAHQGSILCPESVVYLEISSHSAKNALLLEIERSLFEHEKEYLREKIKRYFPT